MRKAEEYHLEKTDDMINPIIQTTRKAEEHHLEKSGDVINPIQTPTSNLV